MSYVVRKGANLTLPKGLPFEHLRVVNGEVLNVHTQTEFWVENVNGVWMLHCAEYPGFQRIQMTYDQINKLRTGDDGQYYIASDETVTDEDNKHSKAKARNVLLKKATKNEEGWLFFILLILFHINNPTEKSTKLISDIVETLSDSIPLKKIERVTTNYATKLKRELDRLWSKIDDIDTGGA
jgi:hypothetical protein